MTTELQRLRGCMHAISTAACQLPTFEVLKEGYELEATHNIVEAIMKMVEEHDKAVRWIGVVCEELANAGYARGDRTVALATIRMLIKQAKPATPPRSTIHRAIQVRLACTEQYVNEDTVKVLGIEEDIQGRDILTFTCPVCNREHRSMRYGRR